MARRGLPVWNYRVIAACAAGVGLTYGLVFLPLELRIGLQADPDRVAAAILIMLAAFFSTLLFAGQRLRRSHAQAVSLVGLCLLAASAYFASNLLGGGQPLALVAMMLLGISAGLSVLCAGIARRFALKTWAAFGASLAASVAYFAAGLWLLIRRQRHVIQADPFAKAHEIGTWMAGFRYASNPPMFAEKLRIIYAVTAGRLSEGVLLGCLLVIAFRLLPKRRVESRRVVSEPSPFQSPLEPVPMRAPRPRLDGIIPPTH